ncbi:DUF4194 domain-containing protein [Haploplasma axanthum]|uniref:DUF4194 domain-containing protein n=1 Tax=Haploplasma axanthum TaxID=29552 RepID=A0A449BDY7_HAPAX|nr:DUF4194 domain-containing protein [Haploplasma axanthum]VEU80520.1 Uncharacterised protein [Haploplasma axanthum]
MNKTTALKNFNDNYSKLKEGEKNNFSRIVNKLLQVNFLTKRKPGDQNDFRFILAYKETFEGFFALIDFILNIHREDEVIYIINEERYNHITLRKTESILILVLRIIFQRKQELVTLDEDVEVYLSEIHDELTRIGYLDNKRITKTELKPALTFLRSYNIIDYIDKGLNDDARIKIYPTILYVTNLDGIKEVIDRLDSYVEGMGGTNEETYEN